MLVRGIYFYIFRRAPDWDHRAEGKFKSTDANGFCGARDGGCPDRNRGAPYHLRSVEFDLIYRILDALSPIVFSQLKYHSVSSFRRHGLSDKIGLPLRLLDFP